jgi:hypothetical protein
MVLCVRFIPETVYRVMCQVYVGDSISCYVSGLYGRQYIVLCVRFIPETVYRVMCQVYALYAGTKKNRWCDTGDTHYAARNCGKRHSLLVMSWGGVIGARLQLERRHYALELHRSSDCTPCV